LGEASGSGREADFTGGYLSMNKDFDFEILKNIGVLSWGNKYSIDLSIVKWGNYPAKYDLRRWKVDEAGDKTPTKGISLSIAEIEILKQLLNEIESFNGELNKSIKR